GHSACPPRPRSALFARRRWCPSAIASPPDAQAAWAWDLHLSVGLGRQIALDGTAQPADALLEALRRIAREIDAQRVGQGTVWVEHAARHERHLLLQREAVQLVGVELRRLGPGPQEHAAGRDLPVEPLAQQRLGA